MNGEYSNVWFDRREISIEALECRKSLSSMYETVKEMIVRESEGSGLALNRIVVGGTLHMINNFKIMGSHFSNKFS